MTTDLVIATAKSHEVIMPERVNTLDLSTPPVEGAYAIWTSVDTKTEAGRALVMRSLGVDYDSLQSTLNQAIDVENVLLHNVTVINTDGEEVPCTRTVLMCADGSLFAATSDGIVKSLRYLVVMAGPPPWKPALKLVPRQINTRLGRRLFALEFAPSEEPKPKGAKAK